MDATTLADVAALKSAPAAHVKTMIRTPDRPTPITIIAVLAMIGAVLLAIGTVTAVATGALLIAVFSALFTVLALACAVGYFGMRRWAVKLYAAQHRRLDRPGDRARVVLEALPRDEVSRASWKTSRVRLTPPA
jgi:hypothetical protein